MAPRAEAAIPIHPGQGLLPTIIARQRAGTACKSGIPQGHWNMATSKMSQIIQ